MRNNKKKKVVSIIFVRFQSTGCQHHGEIYVSTISLHHSATVVLTYVRVPTQGIYGRRSAILVIDGLNT